MNICPRTWYVAKDYIDTKNPLHAILDENNEYLCRDLYTESPGVRGDELQDVLDWDGTIDVYLTEMYSNGVGLFTSPNVGHGGIHIKHTLEKLWKPVFTKYGIVTYDMECMECSQSIDFPTEINDVKKQAEILKELIAAIDNHPNLKTKFKGILDTDECNFDLELL
jgi:hypothetical protein